MYCSRCGTAQADNAAFCGSCGQPLGAALRSPAPATPSAGVAGDVIAPMTPAVAVVMPAYSPYAGFWLRFVAYVIDALMCGLVIGFMIVVIAAIVGVGTFRQAGGHFDDSDNPFLAPAVIMLIFGLAFVLICAIWLYYALLESSVHQGTLGKMALGLIVTDMQGRRVTFGRASGRFFAKLITGLIPFWIGYIMAGFTQKKQALHDLIASCLVLKKT